VGLGCRRKTEDRPADGLRPAPQRAPSASPARPSPAADMDTRELSFDESPVGAEKALVLVPRWGNAGDRFPVLVALHGRGESVRGVDAGARGWLRDYGIDKTIARLRAPPLTREDFMGFVDDARLAKINASLARQPFRGLIVVCPWVPDVLSDRYRNDLDAAAPFGDFVVRTLLPRVVETTPALTERAATGIDGVSLGGRVALQVGLSHPDRFGATGTLQAAIQRAETGEIARRARLAVGDGGSVRLRLLTSDHDYFRRPIEMLHDELAAEHVPHDYALVVGPHDYVFNRGPGGIEMLLWHDRALRAEESV
jgi:enterochelin esterase-like enzyme